MLTPEELAEIKGRAERHRLTAPWPTSSHPDLLDLNRLIDTDVPALLAEIERLCALLEDTRARGAERLKAAEDLCIMYSWSAAHAETKREKAAHELWRRWYGIVGSDFLTADAHPDLSDAMVDLLAAQRDETRARTLARIRSDAPSALPGGEG